MYPEGPITDLQHPDEEMKTVQKALSLLLETTIMALPTDDWDITTISVVHDGTATYTIESAYTIKTRLARGGRKELIWIDSQQRTK